MLFFGYTFSVRKTLIAECFIEVTSAEDSGNLF